MHNRALKKMALALTFWLALHASSLKAQILGPYGTSPITFEVDANGLLSATGTFGTGSLSLSGAGTRMFWYPGKAAFRAGYVDGIEWNDSNIGQYSVALGWKTEASGFASVALGSSTFASGRMSTAFGTSTSAAGDYSVAFGWSTYASGFQATTWGDDSTASGNTSTAFGFLTTASGNYSTASGIYTTTSAYDSFAIGRYNVGNGNPTTWVPADPLFEVGNGNSGTVSSGYVPVFSDAFVVYKNGNAAVQGNLNAGGVITAQPGGDIPMFQGN